MSVEIRQLKENDEIFYPVVAAEGVIFENGDNLEEKITGGVVSSITMNGNSYTPTAGVINLGTIPVDVSGKEDKSNKVTSISSSSTDTQYPSAKAVYDEIHPTIASSQPAGGMLPNKLYNLGTISGNVTFTLASPINSNIVNHYYWTFDTSSTAPTITWPAGITKWNGDSAPEIVADAHYEVSVLGGIGAFIKA